MIEPVRISGGVTCPECGGSGFDPHIHVFLPPSPPCRLCGGLGRVNAELDDEGEYVFAAVTRFGLVVERLVRFDLDAHAAHPRYRVSSALHH